MIENTNLIKNYIELTIEHGNALQNGDKINANKSYKKLGKTFNLMKNQIKEVDVILLDLMIHDNYHVQAWAAVHSLSLEKNIREAKTVLKKLSKRSDIGVARLNAEMVIENWENSNTIVL